MNKVLIIFFTLLAIVGKHGNCQTNPCKTIYTTVDENPAFEGGMSALMDYSAKNLSDILKRGQIDANNPTGKLAILLTISSDGKVVDTEFSNHRLTNECVDELKKKLLTMTGWKPATVNGQNVCCKFGWLISCIKWG